MLTVTTGPFSASSAKQGVPIKDSRQGRQLLFHFRDRGRLQLFVLDPPEHEGQSHRQASQLTFSLSYMVRIAMIRPPAPETSMSTAGACPEWELVLHAFFRRRIGPRQFR